MTRAEAIDMAKFWISRYRHKFDTQQWGFRIYAGKKVVSIYHQGDGTIQSWRLK